MTDSDSDVDFDIEELLVQPRFLINTDDDDDDDGDDEIEDSSASDEETGIDFGAAGDESAEDCSRTYGSITVKVVKGEIANQEVDVIVNSAPKSLKLNEGAASKSLLVKGGNSIQQECNSKYSNGISEGDIAITSGGNAALRCKQIYHACLSPWNGGKNKMMVQKVLLKCLQKASDSGHSSVAFPALGTGILNYDKEFVAKSMFAGVEKFSMNNPGSSVTDVIFVIYPSDSANLQAFLSACNKKRDTDTSPRTECSVNIKNLTVNLKIGQLHEQQSDVVMTTSTRGLDLKRGTLSNSLLEAAGPALQAECASKYPQGIQHGEIAILSPGNLNCKMIYCGALPRYDKPQSGSDPKQLLTTLVTKCLQQADKDKMESISFPTLGTGYLMYPPKVAASIMLKVINNFSTSNGNSSVKTVNIVILGLSKKVQENLEPFRSECQSCKSKPSTLPLKLPKPVRQNLVESPTPVRQNLVKSPSPVVQKLVKPPTSVDKNSDEASVPVRPKLTEISRPARGSLQRFSGLMGELNSKLSGARPVPFPRRRTTRSPEDSPEQSSEMSVERGTPQFCIEMYQNEIFPPANWSVYTPEKNVKQWKIEQKGKPAYTLKPVTRSTFQKIEKLVQNTWEPAKLGHGRDALGLNDLGFKVLKVTKIERIENLTLYEQYCQKRQHLFHKSGEALMFKQLQNIPGVKYGPSKTEKSLDNSFKEILYQEVNEGYFFHGTKKSCVEKLLKQGLDPRMAHGGAVLGAAVYMAESSTKADQYTDDRNSREKEGLQMFLVKASLGNICLMKNARRLKRPPCCESDCEDEGCDHDNRYDSVVSEEQYIFREFVVYDSHQVYPEYVITYDRV